MSSHAHWVGQEDVPHQVPPGIGMLSFFLLTPHLGCFLSFSVKLTKGFFLDLGMFLKAATLCCLIGQWEKKRGSSKRQFMLLQ